MHKDHGRGVWGHAPPGNFRPSEITFGAFSSKFTLPMICIYYTLLTMQPCIEKNGGNQVSRGGEILARGDECPPPPPPPPLNEPLLRT